MRCFVAVVPPESIVEELAAFLEPRREALSGWRWTDQHQWHLTCAFMADAPEADLDELETRLAQAAAKRHPLRVRLAGGGAFPNAAAAKVVWIAPRCSPDDLAEMGRLATGCRNAAASSGVTVEGGPFTPHVTLARLKQARDVTSMLGVLDSYTSSTWTADSVQLIASHLGQGRGNRPRYEVLGEYPLLD